MTGPRPPGFKAWAGAVLRDLRVPVVHHAGVSAAGGRFPLSSLAPVRWEVPASARELIFSANAEVPDGCVLTLTLRHFTVTDA